MCYRYFIAPVLTLERAQGGQVWLHNIGGMDAEGVRLGRRAAGREEQVMTVGTVAAGSKAYLGAAQQGEQVRVVPGPDYRVL